MHIYIKRSPLALLHDIATLLISSLTFTAATHSRLSAASPERESGERLPFSLLLRDDAELGLDVEALLEN